MAGTLLGSLFSKSQTTFTSDTGVLMWRNAEVVKVSISPEAEVTNSPVQVTVTEAQGTEQSAQMSSATIALELSPYKILMASKVEVELFCKTIDTLTDLIQTFKDDTLLVDMISKSAVVRSLAMIGMRISNNPKVMNATRVVISFEQAPPKRTDSTPSEQGADSDVLGVGTISLSPQAPTPSELFDSAKKGIEGLF